MSPSDAVDEARARVGTPEDGQDARAPTVTRYEISHPFLWWHTRFAWNAKEKRIFLWYAANAHELPVLKLPCPGRDGRLLCVMEDGKEGYVSMRLASDAVADAYFHELVHLHAISVLRRHVRLMNKRRKAARIELVLSLFAGMDGATEDMLAAERERLTTEPAHYAEWCADLSWVRWL
jgi:hypothetical protein